MPYNAADVRARPRILRMLLGGPPKSGKTVAAVKTAPGPVFVFNTDGKGALDPVVALGGEFTAADITDIDSYRREMSWFKIHSKEFATVVFDNITMFSGFVEAKYRKDPKTAENNFAFWTAYDGEMMQVFHELRNLPHHLVIVGHINPGTGGKPGGFDHVLGVSGKSKTSISALMQDWVWLNVENTEDGLVKREFLLAPQGNWTKGVRSIQNTARMDANVTQFITLMQKGSIKTVPKTVVKPVVHQVPVTKTNNVKVNPS